MEVPSVADVLLIYGPLGVLALIGLYAAVTKDKQVTTQTVAFTNTIKAITDDYGVKMAGLAGQIKAQADDFARQVGEMQTTHYEQMGEMMDRFVDLTKQFGERNQVLLEKVVGLTEALQRRAGGGA